MATNFETQSPIDAVEEDFTHKPPVIDLSNPSIEDPEDLGGAGKHKSRKTNPLLLGLLGLCGVGLLAWFGLSLFEPKKVVSVLPPEPKVQAKSATTTVESVNPSANTVNMAAPSTSSANAINATTSATPTATTTSSPVSVSTTVTTNPPAQNTTENKPKEVLAVSANESAKKASPEAQPATPAKAVATTEEKPVQAKKRIVQKDKPSWFVVNP